MGLRLQGSRFMNFHRVVLWPPLVLLTLTCLYTSSILRPYSSRHRLSFAHDVQCLSCEASAFPSRAFLSFENLPAIKDVVVPHNFLKVENSRREALAQFAFARAGSLGHGERIPPDDSGVEVMQSGSRPEMIGRIREGEQLSPASDSLKKTVSTAVVTDEEPVWQEGGGAILEEGTGDEKNERTSLATEGNVEEAHANSLDEHKAVEVESIQPENRHLTSDDIVDVHGPQLDARSVDTGKLESPIEPSVPVKKAEYEIKFTYDNMSKELTAANIAVEKVMDSIKNTALFQTKHPGTSFETPIDKDLILLRGAPQGTAAQEPRSCEGRRVFVYDLPSKFNADLLSQCDTLLRWFNFCKYFMNDGMGSTVPTDERNERGEQVLVPDGAWYLTHQYALELIFHARLKYYPCLTTDANRARLFFVPFYAGLDVIRWHFKDNVTNDRRDELTHELVSWLETQEPWKRNHGLDHVLVLGKIGWDFRRPGGKHWGSQLLRLPSMGSPTKLLIERDPWHHNDIGVPHPTFFHPKDDDEIRTWLTHVEQSERRHLVSFAGMPRPNMLGNVRGHLIQQCLDHPDDCFLLRCEKTLCLRPDSTMNLFLHSHFCMQPPGDSPTRRSVFDSLIGGCIPVLFDPYTAYYQYPWHLPQNASTFSVYIPSPHVMDGHADIVGILKTISPVERIAMRNRIIREIVPGLLYSKAGTRHSAFRDAFDISMEALLNRVASLRDEHKSL